MSGHGRGRRGRRPGRAGGFGPFFFGPGGFPRGRARRGDVRAAALLLLAEGPLNGYQIMQEIEALVRAVAAGEQRRYELTDSGKAYVEEHRGEWGAPWEQMTGAVDDEVGALFRELRRVGMAAGQIGHLGAASQVTKARGVLADARRALYALLGEDDTDQ